MEDLEKQAEASISKEEKEKLKKQIKDKKDQLEKKLNEASQLNRELV